MLISMFSYKKKKKKKKKKLERRGGLMVSALDSGASAPGFEPWGPFLESPDNFSGPESHSKIAKLMISELFYSRIFLT